MKKLFFTFLVLMLSVSLFGQTSTQTYLQERNDRQSEEIDVLTGSYIIGAGGNVLTYEILWQFTDLKPKHCKIISTVSGVVISSVIYNIAYDFNHAHMGHAITGGLTGSVTFNFLIGKDKYRKRHSIRNKILKR